MVHLSVGTTRVSRKPQGPDRLSPAAAIKAIQSTLRDYRVRPKSAEENLWSKLRLSLLDDYERRSSKTSRNYPRKKKRERIRPPKITSATRKQINAAKELRQQETEYRLPA